MVDTEIYSYEDRIRQIDHIDFGILSNAEKRRISALGKDTIGIDIPDLYDNLEPKRGGLIDPRLGPSDNNSDCATCGLNSLYCIGHFGHIELAEPIFHINYLPFVKKILSCICLRCSRLLIYKNEEEIMEMLKNKSGKSRMNEIRNLVKGVTYCQRQYASCGTPVSKIKLEIKKSTAAINLISETDFSTVSDEGANVNSFDKKKNRQLLTPDIVYDILKNISDSDCRILGLDPEKSRPENMIQKIFPVPPVQMRPSAKADFMASSILEDDLTHKLADIIKANIRIRRHKESVTEQTAKYNIDHNQLLQFHGVTYMDNDALGLRSEQKGKVIKSLGSRLKGKEGRVRGNLMGKRVDFSARTVITSDPTISINQLGVPIKIAMNLTFPEVVTPENINHLTTLVRRGRDEYPGANFVFPASQLVPGQRILPIDLRYRKEKVELRYGDIVERHMIDDDIVLLNRQPTLHKQSMMGHRIKVINNPLLNTLRLNVSVTTPYNADFDGDEMNIFVPQSIQTQIELEEIADVKRQIITPATSRTIIGIVQDALVGSYNLTSPGMRIDWRNAMNIISYTGFEDFSNLKKNYDYSGLELFSLIIPPKINVNRMGVEIQNGKLNKGQLNKEFLGSKKKNALHQLIWDQYGVEETKNFLDNVNRLVNNFNLYNSFTVGIGDINISESVEEQIHNLFQTKDLKVNYLITEFENNPDLMTEDLYERTIFAELNNILEDVSKLIMKNLKPNNNFGIMINAGSKGEGRNMGQITGCVGMQAFEGKLIPKIVNKRTLPYFFQNDDRYESRGLIKKPYVLGMTYPEFFYHNMTGRSGLIDSAVKTAESGYIQRKLVKSMEDILIKYDRTVRTANNAIVQFIYGDTGSDTTKQYEYNVKILEMGDIELKEKYKIKDNDLNKLNFSKKNNDLFFEEIINLRDKLRLSQIKSRMDHKTLSTIYMLPINLPGIVENIKNSKSNSNEKLYPQYIIDKLELLLENNYTKLCCIIDKDKNNKNSIKYQDEKISKTSFKMALYDAIAPAKCIYDYKLNKDQFDNMINDISNSYNKSIAEAGEMVGIIAAQSCGEPTTQMSVTKETMILIKNGLEFKYISIGEFIDNLLKYNKKDVINVPNHKDSVILDISNYNFEILSVSNLEKVSWKNISQISRHPCNGNLIKVFLKTGRTITTTLSHSHLKRVENGIIPIKGKDLKIGDRIPVAKNLPLLNLYNHFDGFNLNNDLGWLIGIYLSNGYINSYNINEIIIINDNLQIKNKLEKCLINLNINFEINVNNYLIKNNILALFLNINFGNKHIYKKINPFVYGSNKEFILNLISGIYDGNGYIENNTILIKFKSINLINNISLLLNYVGIYGSINNLNNEFYSYQIHKKYIKLFKENIILCVENKLNELNNIINFIDNNKYLIYENIDNIPLVNKIISECLNITINKKDYDRETLGKFINLIEERYKNNKNINKNNIIYNLEILKQAYNSDIIWDEIVEINILEDNKEYVYDFTIPGTETFMVGNGILVHNTLNSFHSAGIAAIGSITQGVPRIKELLSLTKKIKTPQMIIYLTKEFMANGEMAHKIASYIKYTTLGHIIKKINVYYDPEPNAKDSFMNVDNVKNIYYTHNPTKNSCQVDINGLPWLMRIELDREKLLDKEVTMLEIKSKFCNVWEKRYTDMKNIKKEEKYILERITQIAVISNTDNDINPIIHIRFEMSDYNIMLINQFIEYIIDKFKLKGIPHIDDIATTQEERVLYFDGPNHDVEKKTQFAIYTVGINLIDIRYINGIDPYRTICNDVIAMYETFGIESARATLLREIAYAYERAGSSVNYHHLSILVDLMTNNGFLTSIDRHGMNKSEVDPLSRASFEKTIDQIITAAVFGEVDHMKGVSSRIMTGLVVKGGTGMCNLILDTEMLEKSEYTTDIGQKYEKTFIPIIKSNINDHFIKNIDNNIFIPMDD